MLFSGILQQTHPGVSQLQGRGAGEAQVAVCHGSFVTGEMGDSSEEEEMTHELLASLKNVKFCCTVLEFGVSLLNPNRDCC